MGGVKRKRSRVFFLGIRGETAARRPLLVQNLRISFFCQETGRGGIKRATKWQVRVSEVRKGGGSETEKKQLVLFIIIINIIIIKYMYLLNLIYLIPRQNSILPLLSKVTADNGYGSPTPCLAELLLKIQLV